jgi:hypothetical protein
MTHAPFSSADPRKQIPFGNMISIKQHTLQAATGSRPASERGLNGKCHGKTFPCTRCRNLLIRWPRRLESLWLSAEKLAAKYVRGWE